MGLIRDSELRTLLIDGKVEEFNRKTQEEPADLENTDLRGVDLQRANLGHANLRHCLDVVGVERILTAEALVSRLESQGIDLSGVCYRFVCVENIRKLQQAFEETVTRLTESYSNGPCLEIDSEIEFHQISPELLDELKSLEPYGSENPTPIFAAKEIHVVSAAMVGKHHRRMSLMQSSHGGPTIDAIQFNLTPETPRADRFDCLAFRLQWNQYRGKKRIQIVVEDY